MVLLARLAVFVAGAVAVLAAPKSDRVRVPGASFAMGSTPEEMVDALHLCKREVARLRCEERAPSLRGEGHAHTVTVSTFDIDRTEVTVRAYARCVDAGYCSAAGTSSFDERFARPDLPVVMVLKRDAEDFCRFNGGRLPTEAEWELAARGPTRRTFPWGNLYNPRLANHGSFASDDLDASDGFEGLAPVGSFPDGAGPYGTLDQAGNAAEWVADGFAGATRDGFGYEPTAVVNPKIAGDRFIVRGGAASDGALWLRGAARIVTIQLRSPYIGFRCAYDVR